ncbi:K+-dependent Na+/Ca+ exchanger [Paraliobacillus quinghaiensis]|uniref:K+-dependent Na+/Ca+ exchanger n=1 Tax=Paraliobacillus quinghaiensis TaxID=470815 RepID=A0A917TYK1_9BACI|nr:calcium/sodium antiporter [Paraliobacillus quinghaiensis]GGM42835.1 K+-dependent Na+/Ca+ exchanger [Paraliobacillus quinghaiensis]
MTYVLLIIGFALLIKGADFFVEGASKIATDLRVSPLLIGLTIVAFGTSAPEATVSILAALEGNAGVAIGNVVGSNIFNITFVVGIAALIYPLKVERTTIRKEIPFTLLAGVALLILISDVTLQQLSDNFLTRSDGFIFLLFFAIFLYYIFEVARNNREKLDNTVQVKVPFGKNTLLTIGGLGAIIFGGDLVVGSATDLALSFGMSETLVGLTIVAVGTSLPELITSITAALKKESEIALGNIVGSNIFNILFVLGISSVISPLAVDNKIFFDILVMNVLTIILLVFSRSNFRIGKNEGGMLAAAYIAYMIFIIIRN